MDPRIYENVRDAVYNTVKARVLARAGRISNDKA